MVKRKHHPENISLVNFPITPIIDEQYDNVNFDEDDIKKELDVFSRDVTIALNDLTKEWSSDLDLTTDHKSHNQTDDNSTIFPFSQYGSLPDHYNRTKPSTGSKKNNKTSIFSAWTQKRNQLR